VTVLKDGKEEECPSEKLQVGNLVHIVDGERLAADVVLL